MLQDFAPIANSGHGNIYRSVRCKGAFMKNRFNMILLAAPLGMLVAGMPVTARTVQQSDQSVEPSTPAPALRDDQSTQSSGLHPFAQSIMNATDPSAAVEAYAEACRMCPDATPVQTAYVQRMTEFGLPEMAESQARMLVSRDSNDGLAWGVVAYMDARRGQSPAALAEIVQAVKLAPDDEFIQRTAGQLTAWYDSQADQAQVPDSLKSAVASLKSSLGNDSAFTDAYQEALESFRSAPAGSISEAPDQSGYPTTSDTYVEPTSGDDLSSSPYVNAYVNTNVIYTDPYDFGPSPIVVSPWWPSVFFVDPDVFFFRLGFSGRHFHDDDFRFHHFDHDRGRFDHDFDLQRITGRVDHFGRSDFRSRRFDGDFGRFDRQGTIGRRGATGQFDRTRGPQISPRTSVPQRRQPSMRSFGAMNSFHTVAPPRAAMPQSRNFAAPRHAVAPVARPAARPAAPIHAPSARPSMPRGGGGGRGGHR